MTITQQAVNELIKSLESAGELSIKETKVMALAKAYHQLAAENAALKDINAWCKTDAFKNMYREFKTAEALGCSDADCMHDAMLVAIMHAPETPATDRIVAGIKADGVEMFALMFAEEAIKDNNITTGWKARASRAASEYAELLREVADK
ncbi:TPA: hypothetical protein ACGTYA_002550 [Klebsiella pneumoniae]